MKKKAEISAEIIVVFTGTMSWESCAESHCIPVTYKVRNICVEKSSKVILLDNVGTL